MKSLTWPRIAIATVAIVVAVLVILTAIGFLIPGGSKILPDSPPAVMRVGPLT